MLQFIVGLKLIASSSNTSLNIIHSYYYYKMRKETDCTIAHIKILQIHLITKFPCTNYATLQKLLKCWFAELVHSNWIIHQTQKKKKKIFISTTQTSLALQGSHKIEWVKIEVMELGSGPLTESFPALTHHWTKLILPLFPSLYAKMISSLMV